MKALPWTTEEKEQIKHQLLLFFAVYDTLMELGTELPCELWEPINDIVRYRQTEKLAGVDEHLISERPEKIR